MNDSVSLELFASSLLLVSTQYEGFAGLILGETWLDRAGWVWVRCRQTLLHKSASPKASGTWTTVPGDLDGLPACSFNIYLPHYELNQAVTGPDQGVTRLQARCQGGSALAVLAP
jgi:hypothetical protein